MKNLKVNEEKVVTIKIDAPGYVIIEGKGYACFGLEDASEDDFVDNEPNEHDCYYEVDGKFYKLINIVTGFEYMREDYYAPLRLLCRELNKEVYCK